MDRCLLTVYTKLKLKDIFLIRFSVHSWVFLRDYWSNVSKEDRSWTPVTWTAVINRSWRQSRNGGPDRTAWTLLWWEEAVWTHSEGSPSVRPSTLCAPSGNSNALLPILSSNICSVCRMLQEAETLAGDPRRTLQNLHQCRNDYCENKIWMNSGETSRLTSETILITTYRCF